jgi:hypothetical protein
MKIAVIGGGIFGTTAAIKLASAGYKVDLYEKNGDVLEAASGINQYRLHRGYHYPRSASTAVSSNFAEPSFRKEYKDAIIETRGSYYAIAKEGSKVSAAQFKAFCDQCGLEYKHAKLGIMNPKSLQATFKVKESIVNPIKLKEIVKKRLKKRGVKVFLNKEADDSIFDSYDVIVNATYANLNFVLDKHPKAKRDYQFEVCEKLVLKLPLKFKGLSVVVVDGPFFCIDPYGETGYHVMGNVVHAIHKSSTGHFPIIPTKFKKLLNHGIVKNPSVTNFDKFVQSAKYFMPDMVKAEHIGSMYTVRTVLPNVDKTDERPTFVYRVNDKIINIFSGKIGNSVQAAIDTLGIVEKIRTDQER